MLTSLDRMQLRSLDKEVEILAVEEDQQQLPVSDLSSAKLILEISAFDWHRLTVNEVFQRLESDPTNGLTPEQIGLKKKRFGKNSHSPPPSRLLKKGLEYLFGGFGSVLIVAGILSCIAWNPLGASSGTDTSDHDSSNLALGIILFIVAALQLFFTAWQVVLLSDEINCRIGGVVV